MSLHWRTALAATLALPIVLASGALADERVIWLSPLNMSPGNPNLTIAPYQPDASIRVTTVAPGDFQWINLGLALPDDIEILGATVCYELADPGSYISQTRITTMRTPDGATVVFDDPTDHTNPGPTCYPATDDPVQPNGAMTFALRLNFESTSDWVDIGGISLLVRDVVVSTPEYLDEPTSLQLRQNSPNPFNPRTWISYDVDRESAVRVEIHDVGGRLVRTLVDESQGMGSYETVWDGTDDSGRALASGNYYYRVRVGDQSGSRGMVMLK